MNKKYTKKQITEALAYWEKQLEKMDESDDASGVTFTLIKAAYSNLVDLVVSAKDAKDNGTLQDEALSDIDLDEVLDELQDLNDVLG